MATPKKQTPTTRKIRDALRRSFAKAEVYEYMPFAIRALVVDPGFAALDRIEREDRVYSVLRALDDEDVQDVSMLVVLAPGEEASSMAYHEFRDPSPSLL